MSSRWLVQLCIAGAMVMTGCAGSGQEEGKRKPPPVVAGITVQQVGMMMVPEELAAVGTVRAKDVAAIAARLSGMVKSVSVREGDRVARGQLLVELEAGESGAGAAAAVAAVTEAEQGVVEARARQQLADITIERYQKLFQEQAVTRQELDVRRTEREVATQGLARAEARLTQAREQARAAGMVAGYTRISSPIPGIVVAKPAVPGMTVFPGTPLLTVEGGGAYRLEVNAPETLLGRVKVGSQIRIAVDGTADTAYGQVVELVPLVDPASRTFVVKVAIVGKDLRSGTYGRAWFPVGSRQGIMVPKGALFERGALTIVWTVAEDRLARMRLVKAGNMMGDRVEILAGLSAGEKIVVAGGEKVSDGARIE